MKNKKEILMIISITILLMLVACSQTLQNSTSNEAQTDTTQNATSSTGNESATKETGTKLLNQEDLFTKRDWEQETDLSDATRYEVTDNTDITITKEGIYVISGTAKNATVNVEASDEEKVQLVLEDLNISNVDKECFYIENAEKVFITTNTQSNLSYLVTDTENATGAIFSRDDIVFNGKGILTIHSDKNGIVGKDDVKITGGTYNITADKNCIRANDSIRIAGGTFQLKAGSDGLHAENNDDDTKGYIYVNSCVLNINVDDDGIHAISVVQIDGGEMNISASEGIEGTYIQINDGTISISATDDGINAAKKSSSYTPTVEINGGDIKIVMGQGDTDGIDSNGNIIINGGTIDVTGNSTFDYDGKAEHNGGTIIINGIETETIPNQFMGGMPGGRNEQMTPPEMNGEWNHQGMPPDMEGEFNENMTPPDFNGTFNGKKPTRDFKQQRTMQEEETT